MHDDQIAIDVDAVRAMVGEQFPQYRGQPIERLKVEGTVNAIFRIGAEAAARFPFRATDPALCSKTLADEAAAMAELVQHCPFPTPRPLGLGRPGAGYALPWSMQTWVAGNVATPDGLARSETLALDLVTLISTLRAADTRGRPFDGNGRGGDLQDHDAWMSVCFEKSEGLLDVPRLRQLWAKFRELPRPGRFVMSHKDLIPGNLLVDGEHLVGVLDGGGFGPADPALDLVAAWHLFEYEARQTLRERLEASVIEWQRGAAWAFQQAMGLVWYYQHSNPGMAALGRSTLRRILDDADI
ncbi:MAG TPA: aminoglycoside phosphotransferase family protein [Devosia sp.]